MRVAARRTAVSAIGRSDCETSLQISREDRHLEIVAALVIFIVDEQHTDKLLADIDFGGIILFWTRHDTQFGVAEQASHITFQLTDLLDVHDSSFARGKIL